MTPPRKPNGQLACGCRPYHTVEDPEQFHLCAEGKRLYRAHVNTELYTEEGAAASKAYIEHIGMEAEKPEEVVA